MARNNRRQTRQACNARNFTAVKFASPTEILHFKSVHNYGGGNSYFLNTSPSSWLIPSTTRGIMGLLPIIPSVLIMFNHKRRLRTRQGSVCDWATKISTDYLSFIIVPKELNITPIAKCQKIFKCLHDMLPFPSSRMLARQNVKNEFSKNI